MSGCNTNLLQKYTALSPGGPMFSAWLTPPLTPLLRLHVFNITNPAAVLAGQDPVTVELGPYVYTATHIRSLTPVKLNLLIQNSVEKTERRCDAAGRLCLTLLDCNISHNNRTHSQQQNIPTLP